MRSIVIVLAAAALACTDDGIAVAPETSTSSESTSETATETSPGTTDSETSTETGASPDTLERWVQVLLDGEPLEGALVMQGGTGEAVTTGPDGRVLATLDMTIPGEIVLMAAHELARTKAKYPAFDEPGDLVIELATIAPGDNEAYLFNDPGVPDVDGTTLQCGHCHVRQKDDWHGSPHRRAASNPVVHDIYAGAAAAFGDAQACASVGGQWWVGVVPGTGEPGSRCYVGAGALPDLNEGCGDVAACDAVASEFGACADCHAPAIDGVLGGRDLLEAVGISYEAGVHCDLCHKVESIDIEAPPGVAGRLQVHRPLEPTMSPGVGLWLPLAFGPYPDVPNPRMGVSARDHFTTAEFCAGCHQLDQAALVPGTSLDPLRWPGALLPIHSTYEEWRAGPFFEVAPCPSCHMPADPETGNGADLDAADIPLQGIARGWLRPPGAVRRHSWVGPRTPDSGMLQLAAAIFIDKAVVGQTLTATVTVRNAGAGHAIPTGEPLRSLLLFVRARCGAQPQVAIGGDAIPEFGGWLDRKESPEDWSIWPGAQIGDIVRVVVDEGFVDYEGFGPFGDGSFDPVQKGLPRLRVVGQATIIDVVGDVVTFDVPLPAGDLAYRGRPDAFASDPLDAAAVAGAPGFAFARVLADADGVRSVPHHRAVDIVSDNRILPQQEWNSTHEFAITCEDPIVDAILVHRAYPIELAAQRGWSNPQQVMAEVSK